MKIAKPLSRPLPNATLPRNTFDRGFFMRFNTSLGIIAPLFCQFVPAGSKFRINRSIFMRTSQLNTAAFPQLDFNIDFYNVPINLLFSRYDEFKLNTQDNNSSAYGAETLNVPTRLPYFKVSDLQAVANDVQNNKDILGAPVYYGCLRLLDLLGYDDALLTTNTLTSLELNTLKLQAYQKVYYDHYRNTAYESNNPYAYNVDYAYQGANGLLGQTHLKELIELHYVNYRKDYFQALYPGLNYVLSNPSGLQWNIPNSIAGLGGNYNTVGGFSSGSDLGRWSLADGTLPSAGSPTVVNLANSKVQLGVGGTAANDRLLHTHIQPSDQISLQPGLYNVQAIRAAFALDKLLRASAYAPKHVKDQLEARYGVKLRQSYGHESTFLGSFGNTISIGEVTSTANTEQTSGGVTTGEQLGAIGGKGVSGSTGGRTIEYTTESDSIVIGVGYATVRSSYDSHRIDSFNMKHLKEDLPIPEFMDLGLRPLTYQELMNSNNAAINNKILGYLTRDQEYKVSIDENHGLFRTMEALSPFVNHTNSYLRLGPNGTPTAAFFKISPSDLDSIFVTSYTPNTQTSDQFFGQVQFTFSSRQNMSVHGQPSL